MIDAHFAKALNLILDFGDSSPDSQFIEEVKDALILLIGEWIDELQDGFKNGMSDVVIFLRDNFKALIQAGAGPEMGMMIGALGTDTIMNYVTKAYAKYREKKDQLKAGNAKPPQQQEDVKMEEEEGKVESPEAKKKRFLDSWSSIINEDVQSMTRDPAEQRPLSRAYLSVCSARRSQNKQAQDEKNQSIDYMADSSKKKVNFKEEHVRSRIRSNIISAGFPTMKVDEVFGNIDRLPESLVQAYYDMIVEDLKDRVRNDPDYQNKKGPDGKSPFEFLDKL